jgi:hypothetical protein
MNMVRYLTNGFREMPRRITEIEIEKERMEATFYFNTIKSHRS